MHCSCGNEFETRSTKQDLPRRDLRRVPPVLHGQAEARRHGWPRRALPAAARPRLQGIVARVAGGSEGRPPIGGQAVLEGVMMRTPRVWAVAVRRPDGRITTAVEDAESVAMRRRWLRLPVLRGIVALGESLSIGFRALGLSARLSASDDDDEGEEAIGKRRDHLLLRHRDRLRAGAVQGHAGRPGQAPGHRAELALPDRRGPDPHRHLPRLPDHPVVHPRPATRVPVPRGRAQGHQRAGGRGGADARRRSSATASSTCAAAPRSCSG